MSPRKNKTENSSFNKVKDGKYSKQKLIKQKKESYNSTFSDSNFKSRNNCASSKNKKKEISSVSTSSKEKVKDGPSLKKAKFLSITEIPLQIPPSITNSSSLSDSIISDSEFITISEASSNLSVKTSPCNNDCEIDSVNSELFNHKDVLPSKNSPRCQKARISSVSKISVSDTWISNGNSLEVKKNDKLKSYESTFSNVNALPEIEINLDTDFSDVMELTKLPTNEDCLNLSIGSDIFALCPQSNNSENLVNDLENFGCSSSKSCVSLNSTLNSIIESKENFICNQLNIKPVIMPTDFCYEISDICNFAVDISIFRAAKNYMNEILSPSKSRINSVVQSFDIRKEWPNCAIKSTDINPNFLDLHNSQKENYNLQLNSEAESEISITSCNTADIQLDFFGVPDESREKAPEDLPSDLKVDLQHIEHPTHRYIYTLDLNVGANEMCVVESEDLQSDSLNDSSRFKDDLPSKASPKIKKKRRKSAWYPKKRCRKRNVPKSIDLNLESELNSSLADEVYCDTCDEDDMDEPDIALKCHSEVEQRSCIENELNICNEMTANSSSPIPVATSTNIGDRTCNTRKKRKRCIWDTKKRRCKGKNSSKAKNRNEPKLENNYVFCDTCDEDEIEESQLDKHKYLRTTNSAQGQLFSTDVSQTPLNTKNCNDNLKINSSETCLLEQPSNSSIGTNSTLEINNSVLRKIKRQCKTDISDKSPEKMSNKVICNTNEKNEIKESKLEKLEYAEALSNSRSQHFSANVSPTPLNTKNCNDNPKLNSNKTCVLEQSSAVDTRHISEMSNSVVRKSKRLLRCKTSDINDKSPVKKPNKVICNTRDENESKLIKLKYVDTETNSHSQLYTSSNDNSKSNNREACALEQSSNCNVLDGNSTLETSNSVLKKSKKIHEHKPLATNEKSHKQIINEEFSDTCDKDESEETELEKRENLGAASNSHREQRSVNICQTPMNTKNCDNSSKLNSRETSLLEQSRSCNALDSNSEFETSNVVLRKNKISHQHRISTINEKSPKKICNEDKRKETELEKHKNLETTNLHSELYSYNVCQTPMNTEKSIDKPKLNSREKSALKQSNRCSVIDSNSALETDNSRLKKSKRRYCDETAFNNKTPKKLHNENSEFCNTYGEDEIKKTELEPRENLETATKSHSEQYSINVSQTPMNTKNCDNSPKLINSETCVLEQSSSCSVVSNIALETSNSVLKRSLRHKTSNINEESLKKIHNEEFHNICDEGEIKETELENHEVNVFQTSTNTTNCDGNFKLNSKEICTLEESTNYSAIMSSSCSVVLSNIALEASNSVLKRSLRHKTSTINKKSPKEIHNEEFYNTCDEAEIKETELENHEVNVFQTAINTVNCSNSPKLNSKETCALDESTNCSAVVSSSCNVVDSNNKVEKSNSVLRKSSKSHRHKTSTINEKSSKKIHNKEFCDTYDKDEIKESESENHEVNVFQAAINTVVNCDDSPKLNSKETCALEESTNCSAVVSSSCSVVDSNNEVETSISVLVKSKKSHLYKTSAINEMFLKKCYNEEFFDTCDKGKIKRTELENHEVNVSQTSINSTNCDDSSKLKSKSKKSRRCKTSAIKDKCSEKESTSLNNQPQERSPDTDGGSPIKKIKPNLSTSVQTISLSKNAQNKVLPSITRSKKHNKETELNISQLRNFEDSPEKKCLLAALELTSSKLENSVKNTVQDVAKLNKNVSEQIYKDLLNDGSSKKLHSSILQKSDLKSSKTSYKRISLIDGNSKQDSSKDSKQSSKSQDLSKQDGGHTTLQNIILPPNVNKLNNTSTIDIIKSMKPIPKLSNRKTDLNKDLHNVPHSEIHQSNMTHSQRDMSSVENEIDEKSRTSTDTSFEALIVMDEELDFEPDQNEMSVQNSFITDEPSIPASSNEKFEDKRTEFEESLYLSFNTPQDENSEQYLFYPNNSRLISNKRDLPSEDDSDSDDEYNFKRSRRNKSLEESLKSHVRSSSENSYKDAFVIEQPFIRCETTTQSFNDDNFGIFSHFSNSPEKPYNQILQQPTENTANGCGSKNDKAVVGNLKSKVSPGYFLREKDVVIKIREYCEKKLISEAVEIARTYIRISCSDEVNKFIIQELSSNLLKFIDTNNRNIDISILELFDQILKLIDDYNIYDKQLASHFIIRCCSYPELNIHSIKMFHSCQNRHIPLNSKAINIFSSFLQSEEISLPVLLDFIQYVKSVCCKKISKELSNLAFKKCKTYKFSDAHRMCLLLHKISSKEIDPLNLQEFLQLCFKNGMWTHVTEMFLVWDVKSILSNCIYNALTLDYETMSKYFEKFADSLHDSNSSLSPQHKNLFGVIGTALMVGAYYKCELTCALEVLTILHAHNVNYFKLQIQGCTAYLLQNLEDDDKSNMMAFPFLVVFIAIEICLHFKRPRDAYTIFYGFDWVTPDVNLDEEVKAYVIEERFIRLLQLVPLLNVDNSLDEGFNALNVLLSTTEEDITAKDLKWKIKDLQTIYNEYLISLLNSGKISFVKDLYQHSLGPCKDIFIISPEVLRGLIITFSENKMIEETNALFMLGMIKKIYSIEKPQPESFPWELTVMTHWTVQEIKLAVEWFLDILLPLLTEKPRKTDFEKWFAMKIIFKTGEQVESKLHCLKESASDREYVLKKVAVALNSMEPSLAFIQESDEFNISIIPDSLYQFRQCRCPNVSPKVASLSNTVQKTDETKFSFGKELSKRESSTLSNQHNSDCSNDLTKQSPVSQLQSPHAGFQHSESTENVCGLISEIRTRTSKSPVLECKENASSRPCQIPTNESCPDSFISPFPRLPESEIRSYDHQQFPQISNLKLIQTSVPSRMDDVFNNKVIDFNSPEYKSLKSQTLYSENKCRQISPVKISPQNYIIKSNTMSLSPKNNAEQERASHKYVSDNQGYSENMEKISDFDALSNFHATKTSQENSVSHCNEPSEEVEEINVNLNFLLSTPGLNKSQKRKSKNKVFKLQTPSNAKQEPALIASSPKPSNSNNCAVKKVTNVKAVRRKKVNANCKFNKSEKFENFTVSLAPNTSVRTFSNSASQLTNKDNPMISHTASMAPNTSIPTVSNTVPQLMQDDKPKTSHGISVHTVPSSDSKPTNEGKPRTLHTVSIVPNISVSTVPNTKTDSKPTNKNKLKTSHTVSVAPNISVQTISSTDSQAANKNNKCRKSGTDINVPQKLTNKNNKCRTSQISKNISCKRLNNNDDGPSIIINVPFKQTESIEQLPHHGSTKVIDVSPQSNISSKSGTDINVPQKLTNKNNKCRTSQILKNISCKRLNNDDGPSIIINVPFKPELEFKHTESIEQLPHHGSTKVIDVSPQPNISSKSGTDVNVPQKHILGVQPKPTKPLIKRNLISLNKGLFSDAPKFSAPQDAQLSSNTSRQSMEIVKNVQRTTGAINLQPSSLRKESSASKPLLCNVTCNDEELNKIIKFLKIKVTQKHKILTTEEQHQRAISLAQTFVKSNNVTKMDSKVMKSLTEFAISNV